MGACPAEHRGRGRPPPNRTGQRKPKRRSRVVAFRTPSLILWQGRRLGLGDHCSTSEATASLGWLRPQDASVTKLWPKEAESETRQFLSVGWTWPGTPVVLAGPMIEPNDSSRSPAPTLAATDAMLSRMVA